MNPYHSFVSSFAQLFNDGKSLPLGNLPVQPRSRPSPDAPVALIFSPHPDDECIVGGLALRLMRECGMRIVNVAVTQGSHRQRQQPRLNELRNACHWIGFELEQTAPNGLEKINPQTRLNETAYWAAAVQTIAAILAKHQPRIIFFPHDLDWNVTHIGTHLLLMDALKSMGPDFECVIVETEFWREMAAPNLMVELSVEHATDLVSALSFHIGEVQRNPYHIRLPAWMQNNVRRAELVVGQGSAAPDFPFAALYRIRAWRSGEVHEIFSGGRLLPVSENPLRILENR